MLYFVNTSTDPAYNQAFEEYVFTEYRDDDTLLLWKNDPAVVCGCYQNVFAEVNVPAAAHEGIRVIRRETGGGTVYHDHGNLNYAFLTAQPEGGLDYVRFLSPVVDALRRMGVPAETGRICDISVGGKKISGSAQKIAGGRVLHHGTLLFSADLATLSRAANGARSEYVSKGVQSSPWPVTNLCEFLPEMTAEAFSDALLTELTQGKTVTRIVPSGETCAEVNALANKKYRCWDWTYGKNPAYSLSRTVPLFGADAQMTLSAKHGVIERCEFDLPAAEPLSHALSDARLEEAGIRAICAACGCESVYTHLF